MDIPQNLSELSGDDLTSLESQIARRIADLSANPEAAPEVADLRLAIEDVADERARRADTEELLGRVDEVVSSRIAEALSGLTETLSTALAPPPVAEDTEDEAEEDAGEPTDSAEAAPEPTAEAETEEQVAETDPTPQELAAEVGDVVGQDAPASSGAPVVTLAARVEDREPGEALGSVADIAELMHEIGPNLVEGVRRKVATVNLEPTIEYQFGNDAAENGLMLEDLLRRHTDAESLVAAGGWCAPSETRYDFFSLETVSNLLDLPEVGVRRGGLKYPISPTMADVIGTDAIWLWTEQDDEDAESDSNVRKTELRIPCVTFSETRLDAHGVTLLHGNLSDRAYPELTRRFVRMTLVGHEHTVNSRFIAAMVAGSTAVTLDDNMPEGSATTTYLQGLALRAQVYRDKYYMGNSDLIEVVTPRWFPQAVASDLSKRGGVVEMAAVEADLRSWLAARNIRVQFVSDYQRLGNVQTFPGSVRSLMYAPGTWVRGNGGRLDLGVVRDSTLNAANDHTALWSEQFLSLMKFGHYSEEVSTPVRLSGATFCCDDEGS